MVPVLRAGLVLLEQAQQVLPASETYHVGYVRDEETLEAKGVVESVGGKCGKGMGGQAESVTLPVFAGTRCASVIGSCACLVAPDLIPLTAYS